MARNAFRQLADALPDAAVCVGRVIAHHSDDTSTVELPLGIATVGVGTGGLTRGAHIRPRGRTVPVGSWAFVRRGRIENRAPSPEADVVMVPPISQTPPPPPAQSGWRTDAVLQSGAVADIAGSLARFDPSSPMDSLYETMGDGVRTAGKLYFEIHATDMGQQTHVGFAVGVYPLPTPYQPDALWWEHYDNSGGIALRRVNSATQSQDWTTPWPWDVVGEYFETVRSNVPEYRATAIYAFCFDLDVGRLDRVLLNNAEIYPSNTGAADLAGFAPFASWAANAPVQAYLRWTYRATDPIAGPYAPTRTKILLATSPAQLEYAPPAGYTPWDGGAYLPPSAAGSGWRTDVDFSAWSPPAVPALSGGTAGFGPASTDSSGYDTMGAARTTGRRYFEIHAAELTPNTAVGYAVGTYASPSAYTAPGVWCELYPEPYPGGTADGGWFAGSGMPGVAFDAGRFLHGDTYGFCFDLDTGRLDRILLNNVEVFPASNSPAAAHTTWAANTPVQPYLWWQYQSHTHAEIALRTAVGTFTYAPPVGYAAWDS